MAGIYLILCVLWVSVCDCTVAMYGHVRSPLYPKPYPADLRVQWNLEVPPGYQIQLTFNYMDIKPSADCYKHSLIILYGKKVLGKFCGQNPRDAHHPGKVSILPPGNHLQLVFVTDDSEPQTHLGFSAFYQAVDVDECSSPVSSHNFEYPCSQICLNTLGSYLCACHHGYQLQGDERTCVLVDCGKPEIPDSELMSLKEEPLHTTYKQNISLKCSDLYQLDGEDSFTCNADGYWESNGQILSKDARLPKCLPVCGMNKKIISAARVFGGEKAALGQIPWQLLLKTPRRGGASLINDRWALTAAHVVDGYETEKLTFYGGMIDGQDRNAVKMETEMIIIHPDYEKGPLEYKFNFDNDIALVKMFERVLLSTNIRPVCLPEKKIGPVMESKMGTISGFGATSDHRLMSQNLQYAHVKEYSELPCFQSVFKVTDNMFCAGDVDQHVDSCKGDAGGPLVIPMIRYRSRDMPYQLKGIVSWGPKGCGNNELKGYYTKVENYLDWIRETMEKN